ncbi:hypothetical protein DRH29_02865 [candidate division Kazan bacterium]|uniref:Uncharacterized protein n=1 Tax=candidate division Kazan bacterium TaxID=2202143 RepID=A0A420ZCH3_UNCK3|nr:MAG: hypothetical protein DRH29_02865 [candidate division Kazan bacterium]
MMTSWCWQVWPTGVLLVVSLGSDCLDGKSERNLVPGFVLSDMPLPQPLALDTVQGLDLLCCRLLLHSKEQT